MTARAGKAVLVVIALFVAACGGGTTATTPEPTPVPTAAPTETPGGEAGVIVFGLDYDPDTLEIIKPTVRFKATYPEIAWSAALSEPAGASSIRIVVASVSSGGAERVIVGEDVELSNPQSDTLANKIDLALLVGNEPGTYVMRYMRDATVLAEGQFTLVK